MTKKKLQTLRKKHQQLKAQIHALEAAEKSRERKRDTRRKILIGAYYLEQAKKNGTEGGFWGATWTPTSIFGIFVQSFFRMRFDKSFGCIFGDSKP